MSELDHREINSDMALFATDPLVGAGLPLWLPAGAAIRHELEQLARDIARQDGCEQVYSPVLGKRALYERSGHWAKFSDDMFPPMKVGGDELVLRPANCPHHAMIYASRPRSYRDLPVRLSELGAMFRAERSGVLSGLSRVRQINLDDTHVFCRPDQVVAEVERALRAVLGAQEVLGMAVDHVRLSRRGADPVSRGAAHLGADEQWAQAEEALRVAAAAVLGEHGLPVVEAEGEAAFYGPKLDLQVHDGRGHEETIATVQLDVVQPERFDLGYTAADGSRQRPVMVHRGTVGSMERVVAALVERYQGRLPLWLAPVQVCVLPVAPAQDERARQFVDALRAEGLRVRLESVGSLGARVRSARQRRDCVVAVLGPAEAAAGEVQVTDVAAGFSGRLASSVVVERLHSAHVARSAHVDWSGPHRAAVASYVQQQ